MTLREVTPVVIKLVEDASGCPRGVGLFFRVLELRQSGIGSPPHGILASIKHPWYIFNKNRSAALGWIRGPLLRNMSRLIAPRSVLEPLGT